MRRLSLSLFLLPSALLACVPLPIPYKKTSVPGVYGRLTERAAAVVGARVAYSLDSEVDACTKPQYEAVTDEEGDFSFAREWSWRPFVLPLVPIRLPFLPRRPSSSLSSSSSA